MWWCAELGTILAPLLRPDSGEEISLVSFLGEGGGGVGGGREWVYSRTLLSGHPSTITDTSI